MSERINLRPQVADLLQDGCRDCFYARNLLSLADRVKRDKDPVPQEVIDEAERINAGCGGWIGLENPNASLVNAEGGPILAISESIDRHCPYETGVREAFQQKQSSASE